MSNKSMPIVLKTEEWDTAGIRYMQPKVNDRGGKSIAIISTQSGRSLHISTPLMMTWGIADFVNENGESDGKFKMSLNFPNADYKTEGTDQFLSKIKAFENQILDDAVKYSDAWFGEELSREVVKHNLFPFLKYPKDKLTKKFDYNRSPAISATVPNYGGKWTTQIYDTASNLLFPSDEKPNLTPMDLVPKMSNVAVVLQCGGLWFGGKGWGLTWKVNQIVVKPRQVVSVYDKCHITLTSNELQMMEKKQTDEGDVVEQVKPTTTQVLDSDEEDEEEEEEEEEVVQAPPPATFSKKKVVKKAVVEEEVVEKPVPKKKIVRKKATAEA